MIAACFGWGLFVLALVGALSERSERIRLQAKELRQWRDRAEAVREAKRSRPPLRTPTALAGTGAAAEQLQPHMQRFFVDDLGNEFTVGADTLAEVVCRALPHLSRAEVENVSRALAALRPAPSPWDAEDSSSPPGLPDE